MCPACLTTIALIAAGTGSAGGLAAVVLRKVRAKSAANDLVRKDAAEEPSQEPRAESTAAPAQKEEPR